MKRITITCLAALCLGTAIIFGVDAALRAFGLPAIREYSIFALIYALVAFAVWICYPKFERNSVDDDFPGESP